MPITPDRLSRLREFGLSEYAARAYLALLDLGVAEARDVSTLSKVPQAKIYHVLEQLHEKGLAVILPEFPKKYAPVPFPEYLDRLHEEHRRQAGAIERDREILADMFRVMGDTEVGNRGFFTVIRGRRNVMAKIGEMIASARTDLLVTGTTGFASRHGSFGSELAAARERGVRLRGLLPLSPETVPKLERLAGTMEIRARDLDEGSASGRVAILIVDSQRAFLINFLPDDDNLYTGKDIGVFTDQEAMVQALDTLVEPHWHSASPFSTRRELVLAGRPPDFTRLYATREEAQGAFRHAIAQGVSELRSLDARPAKAPDDLGRGIVAELAAAGGRLRSIVNVENATAGETLAQLARAIPGSEVRHLPPRQTARYWCFDDREAFFSVVQHASVGVPDELVIHTTSPTVVRSLLAHFDEAWERAPPLEERLDELLAYPVVRPRELGIGRLFEEMREAGVVADEKGRIVLWNSAAVDLFGHDAREALDLDVSAVLGKSATALRAAIHGERLDLSGVEATRRDGTPFLVDLRVLPASESGAHPYALILARPSAVGEPTRAAPARSARPA